MKTSKIEGIIIREEKINTPADFIEDICYKSSRRTEDFDVKMECEPLGQDYVDSTYKYDIKAKFLDRESDSDKLFKVLPIGHITLDSEDELNEWVNGYLVYIAKEVDKYSQGSIKTELKGLNLTVYSLMKRLKEEKNE